MAADADTPVTVGGAPAAGASPGAAPAGDADTPVSIAAPTDAPTSIGGISTQQGGGGFWHDFGGATGGFWGLIKAPVTDSIPANEVKGLWREGHEHPEEATGFGLQGPINLAASLGVRKAIEFMGSDDRKPLTQRMRESFGGLVKAWRESKGAVAGSLVKGLAADPELFFLPGASGVSTAAKVGKVAETLGAGARATQVAGTVAGGAARVGTAAAIGGGAEATREIGEGEPLDPGAIATSSLISVPFGFTQIPTKVGKVKLSPEEIDTILTPSASHGDKPEVKVTPHADGYLVRVEGNNATDRVYASKAEAEAAARQIEETSSAYRSMDTVPRGANERTAALQDNPFTPEKMASMVQRPKEGHAMTGKELATWLGKAAIGAGVGAGVGAYLDKDDPEMGATFGAAITLVPRALEKVSPKGSRITIEDAVNERNGQLAVMARKTLQFKTAIDAAVPEPLRRNAISLYLEGGALGQSIKLNPEELKVAESVRHFFDAMGNTAVDAGVLKELLGNYVSHIVEEDPDAKAKATINKIVDVLMNRRPSGGSGSQGASGRGFAQHRQYASFEELQAALRGSNLKIKTGDIGEIMAIYSKAMFRTITDKRLIEALKVTPVEEMGPMVLPPENPKVPAAGPAIERAPLEGKAGAVQPKLTDGSAAAENLPTPYQSAVTETGAAPGAPAGEPGGFQLPPDPGPGAAARKFAARDRMLLQPQDKADGNYVTLPNRQLAGFAVHKDIAPQLNFIFSARDPNDVTIGLMALNQASKRAIVSFSLFHAKSLSDAFIGAMGGTKAGLNPKRAIAEALAQFKKGGGNDGIDALLKNGLNLQLPEDVTTDHLNGALNRVAAIVDKALPVTPVASAAKGIAAFNNALDHFTFTTLQAGFKLVTGLDAYERLIKKGLPTDKAAKLAASYTNDIYGGLDWFRVANDVGSRIGRDAAYGFFNPNGRRWAQILMFAPDWTFSTFRAAYKALPGAVDDPALAALHRRYLVKSAIYYLTIANSINLITAGHSIFENENPTRVQLGDGRTMQFSKHFMEPAEWLRDPVQTAANKLAFLPREAIEQMTGKEYISAHDAAPVIDNRAEHFAKQFLPINAQQGLAGGGAESLLGLVGAPVYGKTPDQKRQGRIDRKKAEIDKKKATRRYYQRLNH